MVVYVTAHISDRDDVKIRPSSHKVREKPSESYKLIAIDTANHNLSIFLDDSQIKKLINALEELLTSPAAKSPS